MGNREIITGLLKDNPQGMTIQELSSRTRLNRVIVSTVLAELKGGDKVIVRAVGVAKLHYWNFVGVPDAL